MSISKVALVAALVGGASAFSPASKGAVSTALFNGPVLGAGGMADTRDPDALEHEDPRKSISVAPSFEEYLKMRDGGAPAAAAPAAAAPAAPAAAAPAAAAPAAAAASGSAMDVLASMEGPGQVWGADGIEQGFEESDLKGYDNFDLFVARMQSTGVANEIASGEFTIFAPVNSAIETYEKNFGAFDADCCRTHIVKGKVASASVGTADLSNIGGKPLTYKRAFRKDFVNDVIIGEKTFGQYSDYPTDVAVSNGVIHAVGISMA